MITGSGNGYKAEKMSKGKNFSRNRARADRAEADFYQTPYCLTDEFVKAHLINNWPQRCQIADFCCGKMAIQKVLYRYGYETRFSRDIVKDQLNFFDVIVDPPLGDTACICGENVNAVLTVGNGHKRIVGMWGSLCVEGTPGDCLE